MELIEAELREVPQGLRSGRILAEVGVSKATFYRRRHGSPKDRPPPERRPRRDPPALVDRVRQIAKHQYTRVYGYRKVQALLTREGLDVGLKAVRNLMRYHGWQQPRRRRQRSGFDPALLLKPTGINQVWQMDITHLWVERAGWRFLINVVDYHSRYLLVSYYTDSYRGAECVHALQRAREEAERIAGPLDEQSVRLVTDNGSSFTSHVFQEFLQRAQRFRHVRISYRTPELIGLLERLHRTLKEEHIWPTVYETDGQAQAELAAYVEFYNGDRLHQALGYRTPAEVYRPREALAA
jgi:putative transposase